MAEISQAFWPGLEVVLDCLPGAHSNGDFWQMGLDWAKWPKARTLKVPPLKEYFSGHTHLDLFFDH